MFLSKTRLAGLLAVVALLIPATAYATHSWPDVPDGRFYTDAVEWAKGNGMTTGCDGSTNFCPDRNVTRGENITFAKRYDDLVVQPALATVNAAIDEKVGHGTMVLTHGTDQIIANGGVGASSITNWVGGTEVSGDGAVQMALHGPAVLDGVEYGLRSIEYCIGSISGSAAISSVEIWENQHPLGAPTGDAVDSTPRSTAGCYTFAVNVAGAQGYGLLWDVGGGSSLRIQGVQSTWEPVSTGGFTTLTAGTNSDGPTNPMNGN